ncbi:hypothetical protein ACN38_g944 [Penicillium nordicum]|uniref:Uncharacterized protein n=1 Tax=Penicillium nordicum TaxID=229535 RepID=A0A0M8PGC5_9EURO|nr:hypothetical protein ACN38_g944 [Penicillium nordicum]
MGYEVFTAVEEGYVQSSAFVETNGRNSNTMIVVRIDNIIFQGSSIFLTWIYPFADTVVASVSSGVQLPKHPISQ